MNMPAKKERRVSYRCHKPPLRFAALERGGVPRIKIFIKEEMIP